MRYFLMRKNNAVAALELNEDGTMLKFAVNDYDNPELPLQDKSNKYKWLKQWWADRSIPIGRDRVQAMLQEKGLLSSSDYLVRNLGLSLTDYYWIKPIDSTLKWEDVNLYDNDFKENLLVKLDDDCGYRKDGSFTSFTPNSTLQGQLEKSWQIRKGKRVLIKGNPDVLSCDSLNEVFASLVHKKQGYDNYTEYKLIKVNGRPYAWGCVSECFTDQKRELVSAWAVLTSEKKQNDLNEFERFIKICEEHGIDGAQLRRDLEYQIMTDYIVSNRDRHMNNVSVLRDAKTLKFIRMAPIYDTGKSQFVRKRFPLSHKEITNQEINSFTKDEERALKLVSDKGLVDVSKLPSADELAALYRKDPKLRDDEINNVCEAYERKVRAFTQWQNK